MSNIIDKHATKLGYIDLKYNKKVVGRLHIRRDGELEGEYQVKLEWLTKTYWGYKISGNQNKIREKVENWDLSPLELIQIAGPLKGVGTKPTLGFM